MTLRPDRDAHQAWKVSIALHADFGIALKDRELGNPCALDGRGHITDMDVNDDGSYRHMLRSLSGPTSTSILTAAAMTSQRL